MITNHDQPENREKEEERRYVLFGKSSVRLERGCGDRDQEMSPPKGAKVTNRKQAES